MNHGIEIQIGLNYYSAEFVYTGQNQAVKMYGHFCMIHNKAVSHICASVSVIAIV